MNTAEARARLIKHLALEIKDQQVLEAMGRIPRELFVPPESRHLAYVDGPLPIGFDQTISQPTIIAMMTRALELTGGERVLELGTGSGYQTAILAELAREVVTVERIPQLAESARKVLDSLGYRNVSVHLAGETIGWPEEAPYDAIMVTAGAPWIPRPLLEQLSYSGKMVIPVGPRDSQELKRVIRHRSWQETLNLGGCRFVSLIDKDAWQD